MTRFLPPQPDLEHLRNEAKGLLKALEAGDASVCPTLRRLKRFAGAADSEILSASVALTEAQFALAMDYGFSSWGDLRQAVLRVRPVAGADAPPSPRARRLADPPAGGEGNRIARAYQMALTCCGVECDYNAVAGDSGLAFILQSDSGHTPFGADVPALDLGWWPLDEWGAMLRLDFLGRVYGIQMRRLPLPVDDFKADAAKAFASHCRDAVIECIESQRPVVGVTGGCDIWVVTGFDDGTPPLLGQLSCDGSRRVKRLDQYPWWLVTLDDMREPIDRLRADAEALAFACDLHHERFSRDIPGCAPQYAAVKSSGKASFELWARVLRVGRCGPHYYSANVVGCMRHNRRSAPPYLRWMATRHAKPAADRLLAAACIYDDVLAALATADTSKEAFATAAGRCKLADLVDKLAGLEARAAGEMDAAARAMPSDSTAT
jgi:hypothetical protein